MYVALLMLSELVEAQREGRSRDFEALARVARTAPEELGEVLAVLVAERIVICAEDGGWLLARAAEGVRLVEVAQLFGWRRPPAGAELPGSAGCRVGLRYAALLAPMERASDLPLTSLRGGPGL